MGNTNSNPAYFDVPSQLAAPSFGNNYSASSLKSSLSSVQNKIDNVKQLIEIGRLMYGLLSPTASITAVISLFAAINGLLKENQELHQAFGTVEGVYSDIYNGKLAALRHNIRMMEDANTSEAQKLAELVSAVQNLHEMLAFFTGSNSCFFQKFRVGGLLFVGLCGVFRTIYFIAQNCADYNRTGLSDLKAQYSQALRSFKDRCTRTRTSSCYMHTLVYQDDCYYDHEKQTYFMDDVNYFSSA